jgi:tRNA (guanine10-N2)-methyltransferase
VNLYSNFKQYGLSDPAGLLRADTHRPPFRAGLSEWLDAIVCDPPYGIRESARKSEHRVRTLFSKC